MPLFLSANAPNPKMFAMVSSSVSAMICGRGEVFGDIMLCCETEVVDASSTGCWGCTGGGWGTAIGVGVLRLGVVLRMPWRGRFICPLAVAGLGLRYLSINFSLRLGHPTRNPFRTAFNNVEILGLHKDWCVNFTAFARVRTEWVNPASSV